jgi:putative CocE/NonD family hydrolase
MLPGIERVGPAKRKPRRWVSLLRFALAGAALVVVVLPAGMSAVRSVAAGQHGTSGRANLARSVDHSRGTSPRAHSPRRPDAAPGRSTHAGGQSKPVNGATTPVGTQSAQWTPYDRPEQYQVVEDHNVPITMRDGVILRANVYRPDAPGRFPVLLEQIPYGKDGPQGTWDNPYLEKRGYVQIVVDVRGTGASQGTWQAADDDEQRDGFDLVEWAARQPWSDGNVGLDGASYAGINQFLTAALHPPHLRAIFPAVPMGDVYRDLAFSGGDYNSAFLPLWLGLVAAGNITIPPDPTQPGNAAGLAQALLQHIGALSGPSAGLVTAGVPGSDLAYDGPFWAQRSPIEYVDRVEVPTFIVGGLHDIFQRGEPLLFERLERHVTARLLIGPWTHLEAMAGKGLPVDGLPTLDQLQLRWFDQYLKQIDTGIAQIPRVTSYDWGTHHYETHPDWPDPRTGVDRLYLRGGGQLAETPPRTPEPAQQYHQQPISGICTLSTGQWAVPTLALETNLPCQGDANKVDPALGQATYLTAPQLSPQRVFGPITADVWIQTNASDVPVTVRISDVAPDGTAVELTDGWLSAGFRALDPSRSRYINGTLLQPWHPFTQASYEAVPANTPVEVQIEVFPTSATIQPGHRLQLTVAPSDFPHQIPNQAQLAGSLGGTVQVLNDPAHASYLALPVIGPGCTIPGRKDGRCAQLPLAPLLRSVS